MGVDSCRGEVGSMNELKKVFQSVSLYKIGASISHLRIIKRIKMHRDVPAHPLI